MAESAARHVVLMFERISEAIDAAQDRLSELDGVIGDADHGITMALGFHSVCAEFGRPGQHLSTASEVLDKAATTFLEAAGASTGPLYASAFRRASERLAGVERLDAAAVTAMLQGIAAGIGERGKAQRGDKTMLDAWLPAAEAGARAVACGLEGQAYWQEVIAAGEHGANATRSMVAMKGRAARAGQRSLGHIDPGAASTVIILQAMAEAMAEEVSTNPG
ncbi:MAG: dihydroxyacetone kinase subunit DhaL [Ancalomicrobiaceae bacterium]|nr:dihydroxyacetone kinase subunit DhaL [Ancalomicrobiaceae bacterium]